MATDNDRNPLQITFGLGVKVLGSTLGFVAFLTYFGFMSDSALFRFVGLPNLSTDYLLWVESGAAALIDTAMLTTVPALIVAGIAVLLWLNRDAPWLARRLEHLPSMLLAHAIVAVLAGMLVFQLSQVIRLSGDGNVNELALSVMNERHELFTSDTHHPVWSPRVEERAVWRTTVPRLFVKPALDGTPSTSLTDSDGDRLLTRPSWARQQAERLYGLIVVLVVILCGAIFLLWQWRRWRHDDHSPTGRQVLIHDHARARLLSGSTTIAPRLNNALRDELRIRSMLRRIASPLFVATMLFSIGALPYAHGVLNRPYIGHEQVLVHLRQVDSGGKPCAPLASDSWFRDGYREGSSEDRQHADPAKESSESNETPEETITGASGIPKTETKARKSMSSSTRSVSDSVATKVTTRTGRHGERAQTLCQKGDLDELTVSTPERESPIDTYRSAWMDAMTTRLTETEWDGVFQRYTTAVDALFESARKSTCPEVIQILSEQLPEPEEVYQAVEKHP